MIKVIKPGMRSSFQDEGRFGYRNQGVPLSGAMDQYAFHLANHLLNNPKGTAVIEMMLQGPELFFEQSTYIAITGASFEAILNEKKIDRSTRIFVPSGSILKFKPPKTGIFGYIAIQGGIKETPILDSFSYYPTISDRFVLRKEQNFAIKSFSKKDQNHARINVKEPFKEDVLSVYPGPEFQLLSQENQKALSLATFKVGTNSNRMGYEIKHTMELEANEIITAPVQPGTVQLTPSGNLICLMRDAQTTGGYARVFQLKEDAINILAQKRAGQKIRFNIYDSTKNLEETLR